jgi:hypothetical protein
LHTHQLFAGVESGSGRGVFHTYWHYDLEVRTPCQIEITNRFAALENLNDDEDINRAWENIKESIKNSAKESLGLQESK